MDKKISQIVEGEEITPLSHDAVFVYGDDADRVVEIPVEQKHGLAAGVTMKRYMKMIGRNG